MVVHERDRANGPVRVAHRSPRDRGVRGLEDVAVRGRGEAGLLGAAAGAVGLGIGEAVARARQRPGEIPALWQRIATTPGIWFDIEDVEIFGEAATIRWRLRWGDDESKSVRGVNLMRVRGGKIVEARGYVKGA